MQFLLLICLGLNAPEFRVSTLSGDKLECQLDSLTGEKLIVQTAAGSNELDTRQLTAIERLGGEDPAEASPSIRVRLIDGSEFLGAEYSSNRGTASLKTGRAAALEFPTRSVRWIRLVRTAALDKSWEEQTEQVAVGDVVVLRKNSRPVTGEERSSQVLDRVEGILHDITADLVRFEVDGEKVDIKRARLEGLLYFQPAGRELAAPVCRLTDSHGSVWNLKSLRLTDRVLDFVSVAGVTGEMPIEQLRRLDFSVGNTVFLEELTPDSFDWRPFIETKVSATNLNRFLGTGGVSNGESVFVLRGKSFDKGVMFRSRTEVVYRMPKDAKRFLATVGIDDRVGGGDVRLVISADNRVLAERTVRGGDEPFDLSLDIAEVRRLTFLVDFGAELDVGDYLNLCNARITK